MSLLTHWGETATVQQCVTEGLARSESCITRFDLACIVKSATFIDM